MDAFELSLGGIIIMTIALYLVENRLQNIERLLTELKKGLDDLIKSINTSDKQP